MKKIEKVSLIVAGYLMAGGIIFIVLGCLFGGIRDIKKSVVDSTASFLEFYGLNFESLVNVSPDYYGFDVYDYPAQNGDVEVSFNEDIKSVVVDVKAGDIDVKTSSKDVKLKGDGKNIRAFVREDTLYIIADAMDATIFISDETYNSIEVKAGGGDLKFGYGIKADSFKLSAGAGDIGFVESEFGVCDIEIGAGNLEMLNITAGSMNVSAGIGNVEIKSKIEENLDVRCIGNVELDLPGKCEDYNFDYSLSAGTLTVDGKLYKGIGISETIDNGSDVNVSVSTTTGNVEVSFN